MPRRHFCTELDSPYRRADNAKAVAPISAAPHPLLINGDFLLAAEPEDLNRVAAAANQHDPISGHARLKAMTCSGRTALQVLFVLLLPCLLLWGADEAVALNTT